MRRLFFTSLIVAALIGPACAGAKTSHTHTVWLGTIRIPAIGVNLPIEQDNGALEPDNYPMHYGTTALPCDHEAVAIAAHHATHGQPFGRLWQLKAGDVITLTIHSPTCSGTFRYRETGQHVYPCEGSIYTCPHASVGFRLMQQDKLILTTCDNNGSVRRFVYAFATK